MHIIQEPPRVRYEYLAVNGTIANFSTIQFSGKTPELKWGKWLKPPTFPVDPQNTVTFSASGVSIALQYL